MKARRIAKTRAHQQAYRHRRRCCASTFPDYPVASVHDAKEWAEEGAFLLALPLPRPRGLEPVDGPVEVSLELTYPLTDAVPEAFRVKTFKASTVGDVCREIRAMYQTIYAEDERLGGPGAGEVETAHPEHAHIEALREQGFKLLNRKAGAWVWGHDMEDLVVEILDFEWLDEAHTRVEVFVGS